MAPIVIPIVVVFVLAAWIILVFYADSHPLWRNHRTPAGQQAGIRTDPAAAPAAAAASTGVIVVPEVDLETFAAARADGALVIDVREPSEYAKAHVPGAKLIPLARLHQQAGELPRGKPVYLIDASGNRSWSAAQLLTQRGIDARSVSGGTRGWMAQGLPVVRGGQESAA